MSTRLDRLIVVATLAIASFTTAGAQDPRLPGRIDAPTQRAINAVVDSAKAQGLPVQPLFDKVSEAVAKGVDPARIIIAVRSLANEMAKAQTAMGTVATTDELKAAASAMHAGVPAVELGKLKKQSGLRRSLTLPFTVLADIVSRGVPVRTAANAIRSLVGAGAKDKDINDFQRNVKDDIEKGAPPAAAAETRAKAKPEKPDGGAADAP